MERKLKTMNIILILLGITALIFTIVMIYLYVTTGGIPDTLCTCFFLACTGEAGFMGMIQRSKEKYRDHKWEIEREEKMEEKLKQMEQAEV